MDSQPFEWMHKFGIFRPDSTYCAVEEVKLSAQEKSSVFCIHCWLPLGHCLCDGIVSVFHETRIQVFVHRKEWGRSSNTAHLLPLHSNRISLHVHGVKNSPTAWQEVAQQPNTCLLFPFEDAPMLTYEDVTSIDRLIIVDGNWRQSRNMAKRCRQAGPSLVRKLHHGSQSAFRLRRQSEPHRLSTFEAAVFSLSILEGIDPETELLPTLSKYVSFHETQRMTRRPRERKFTYV